jgi:hypothetical protein
MRDCTDYAKNQTAPRCAECGVEVGYVSDGEVGEHGTNGSMPNWTYELCDECWATLTPERQSARASAIMSGVRTIMSGVR